MSAALIGGISSAARALADLDGVPFRVQRAAGAYLWDEAGRRYIDTALGFGATVLGHADARVLSAVHAAIDRAAMPAFAHAGEAQAADALAARCGDLGRIVFTNTGSEAVHLACRIARHATGRGVVAKAAGGYDGWYDEQLLGVPGSDAAALTANQRPRQGAMMLLRYNDFDDAERLFAEHRDVAAVLVEPLLANAGCVEPAPGYLRHLSDVAHRHGALVIADEVLSGFRLHAGLSGPVLGLQADIATLGKAIGSGFAVAAVAMRAELAPGLERGEVMRAGTYSGNPPACAAVSATMAALDACDYPGLGARTERLRRGIETLHAEAGRRVSTSGAGSVFTLWFRDRAPLDYAQALQAQDARATLALHQALRRAGVLTMPGPFGRLFLSFAHDDAVIDAMLDAFAEAVSTSSGPPA